MKTEFPFRTLIDLYRASTADVPPGRVCLEVIRTDRHETLTFGELIDRACGFACWLRDVASLKVGDKVAVVGKNCADWDVAVWGAVLAGVVPVLIDPERPPAAVKHHVTHTDASLLVMADDYANPDARADLTKFVLDQGWPPAVMNQTPFDNLPAGDAAALERIPQEIAPDDTAVILCTSGTTGDPREVELTHLNLVANIEGSLEKVQLGPNDVLGHITPPHHSFGMTVGKFLALRAGATNIYTNKYREVAQIVRDRKVTILVGIPALYTMMAKRMEDALDKRKQQDPRIRILDRVAPKLVGKGIIKKLGWQRVRFCLSGAAPMPKWVLEVLWKRGIRMYEGYGTTENSPVYGYNERPDKLGSVGQPISTLTVKIVDDNSNTLAPGEKGEICLGGPCIMKGYYKNPKATEAVIDTDAAGVRWLHTGDLGYLDKDDHLYITGRKKYLIILPGGKNVNPERVESALSEAPFVHEILVVPALRKDSNGIVQETIRAITRPEWDALQTHTNLSADELRSQPQMVKDLVWQSIKQCQEQNEHLAHFEQVASHNVEIRIDEFEKTSTGKIRRDPYIQIDRIDRQ